MRRRHRAGAGIDDTVAQSLLSRLEAADQKSDRRYNRIAGALKFISLEVQTLSATVKELHADVSAVRASNTHHKATEVVNFPLMNEDQVMEYIAKDPSMQQLIHRYVSVYYCVPPLLSYFNILFRDMYADWQYTNVPR